MKIIVLTSQARCLNTIYKANVIVYKLDEAWYCIRSHDILHFLSYYQLMNNKLFIPFFKGLIDFSPQYTYNNLLIFIKYLFIILFIYVLYYLFIYFIYLSISFCLFHFNVYIAFSTNLNMKITRLNK